MDVASVACCGIATTSLPPRLRVRRILATPVVADGLDRIKVGEWFPSVVCGSVTFPAYLVLDLLVLKVSVIDDLIDVVGFFFEQAVVGYGDEVLRWVVATKHLAIETLEFVASTSRAADNLERSFVRWIGLVGSCLVYDYDVGAVGYVDGAVLAVEVRLHCCGDILSGFIDGWKKRLRSEERRVGKEC